MLQEKELNQIVESVVIDDSEIRQSIIQKAQDIVNLTTEDFCAKYDVTDRTYRNWKRQLVTIYGIEPRLLYTENRVNSMKEFAPYIDDEKLKLPIERQLILPSTVRTLGGYTAKKKTIQIKGDGTVTQVWLKYEQEKKETFELCRKSIIELCKQKVKPLPKIKAPTLTDNKLLTFYPLPDLHFGMLVDKDEVNHNIDYNLDKAKEWVETSFHYLVERSPHSHTCLIADLGDFLHAPNDANRTPIHGNILDVDQKHSKIVRTSFEVMRRIIEEALSKHKLVYFYSVPGNHSEYVSIYLKEFLRAWFKDNKRFIINDTYKAQQYHIFGKNIIGLTHGHELKLEKASEVMVVDNEAIFSSTKYRYFHFGHHHQYKAFSTPLATIEVHNNMPPRDKWAESNGYRGNIGMSKAIVYHEDYGEISRFNFNLPIEKPEIV